MSQGKNMSQPALTVAQARNRGTLAAIRVAGGACYTGPDARVIDAGHAHCNTWRNGYDQQRARDRRR